MDRFLVQAANELHREAVLHPSRSEKASSRRLLRVACNAMRRVEDDLRPAGHLTQTIRLLAARGGDHAQEIQFLLEDSAAFIDIFLLKESEALLRAGLKPHIVDLILGEAQEIRFGLRNSDWSPERLREGIQEFSADVCQAADEFWAHIPEEPIRGRLRNAGWIAAGSVVILANASADIVTTIGMGPAATALSGGLGSGMIGRGLSG